MERMTVFQSFRRRIVVWFLVLLGVTLAALGLTTRTILDAGISEHANADVRQEIDEFQRFAADGTDPATAAAFDSGRRLLEVYLSRQIPGRDEAIVGLVDGQIMQIANPPRPLGIDDAVVREAHASPTPSGVVEDPDRGAVHWARTELAGDDAALIVARFTDTDHAALLDHLQVLLIVGLGALALGGALAWLLSGRPFHQLQPSVLADAPTLLNSLRGAADYLAPDGQDCSLGVRSVDKPTPGIALWLHAPGREVPAPDVPQLLDAPGPGALRTVADAHGGHAFAESAAGQGTVLGVLLPLEKGEPDDSH